MGNKRYEAGRRFEWAVKAHFERLGYFVARSPGSKSPVDIIVIGHSIILLIQCKTSGQISPHDWNELWRLADATCSARAILAERVKRKLVLHEIVGVKIPRSRERPWVEISFGANVAYSRGNHQKERAHSTVRQELARR